MNRASAFEASTEERGHRNMWIFDGEEWIREEGDSGTKSSIPAPELRYEPPAPELQVVEIPITRRKEREIPPFPMV